MRIYMWLFVSVIFLTSLNIVHAAATQRSSLNNWLLTFLVNELFNAEYKTLYVQSNLNENEKMNFVIRKRFSNSKAKELKQTLGTDKKIEQIFSKDFKKYDSKISRSQKIYKTDLRLVRSTFKDKAEADKWDDLSKVYSGAQLNCSAHTKVVDELYKQITAKNVEFKKIVSDKIDEIQLLCVFQRLKSQSKDLIALLEFLNRNNVKNISLDNINVMLAIEYVRVRRYAEALGVLNSAQASKPSLGVMYKLLQRVYSYEQKGEGDVKLNQSM